MPDEPINIDDAPRLPGVDYSGEAWIVDGVQYTTHEDAEAAHVLREQRLAEFFEGGTS
jgi:hypothetical protein